MSRDIYNSIEAINASSIKRHYTGSIQYAAGALERGAEFHCNLLETEPKDMPHNAKLIYDCIMKHPMLRLIFEKSAKEITFIKSIDIDGRKVAAKGILDLHCPMYSINADIKTTSCTNLRTFAADMTKHYNHIQAVWYSYLTGFDPANFYYIGVPNKFKGELFIHRHTADEIRTAETLIRDYLVHRGL
jgi:hypothetical protein